MGSVLPPRGEGRGGEESIGRQVTHVWTWEMGLGGRGETARMRMGQTFLSCLFRLNFYNELYYFCNLESEVNHSLIAFFPPLKTE